MRGCTSCTSVRVWGRRWRGEGGIAGTHCIGIPLAVRRIVVVALLDQLCLPGLKPVELVQVKQRIEKAPRELHALGVEKVFHSKVPRLCGVQEVRKLAQNVLKLYHLLQRRLHAVALLSVKGIDVLRGEGAITVKVNNIEPVSVNARGGRG